MNKKYHIYEVHKLDRNAISYEDYFIACGCDHCFRNYDVSDGEGGKRQLLSIRNG